MSDTHNNLDYYYCEEDFYDEDEWDSEWDSDDDDEWCREIVTRGETTANRFSVRNIL